MIYVWRQRLVIVIEMWTRAVSKYEGPLLKMYTIPSWLTVTGHWIFDNASERVT